MGDTLHLFGFSESATENLLVDYRRRYPDIFENIGDAIQVNGVGNYKLCADLKTMLRILWLLPPNARTAAFRLKCAEDILRQMKGDPSLVAELRRNHAVLQSTGGVHFHESAQDLSPALVDPETLARHLREHEKTFELELLERRNRIEMEQRQMQMHERDQAQRLEHERVTLVETRLNVLEHIHECSLDDRSRLALRDSLLNAESRPAQHKPRQIGEIMELNLKLPPDSVRKWARGAGTKVATEFRARYAPDAQFLMSLRLIDGAERQVKMYAPEDFEWIEPAILAYIEEQKKAKKPRVVG